MVKIKLTKGELKKQRDNLRQFQRYLPTLQLKKQQLQMEILRWGSLLEEKMLAEKDRKAAVLSWAGLLAEPGISLSSWIAPREVVTGSRNVAGVDIPVFERAEFAGVEYDLFLTPPWVDAAIDLLRELVSLREEIRITQRAIEILRHELRITTQRVNLFERVKIPEAEDAIRRIKIYVGDQMANAVGRSKIAKRKIETLLAFEVAG
ncbi:MAG: V-type ATP synthase subunit D [Candidatus Omnitrophica bacterium]|nr:V-type ATP synthase subunit D [Candidatus Omnitrophota bacterium]